MTESGAADVVGRRIPLWLGVAAALAALLVGGVCGWALRGTGPGAATSMTAEQAKQRACNAYASSGHQWGSDYRQYLPQFQRPGWLWSDDDVKAASNALRSTSNGVAATLGLLMPPNAPADVRDAINGYLSAILSYSAGLGVASQEEMNEHESAIDAAATRADQACGLAGQ